MGSLQIVTFTETLRGAVRAAGHAPRWDDERLACALAAESVRAPAAGLSACVLADLAIAVDAGTLTPDGGLAGVVRSGRVEVEGLPPLTVGRGLFELFPRVPGDVRRLRYHLSLNDPTGAPWRLRGTKLVVDEAPGGLMRRIWSETTTLYVLLEPLDHGPGTGAYTGVVQVRPSDFARQLASLRGEPGPAGGLRAVHHFATEFWSAVAEVYLRGGADGTAAGIEAAFDD
jgi:hypothetical protein